MDERSQIYDLMLQHAVGCRFDGVWSRVPCHREFFDLGGDLPALWTRLQAAFQPDALIAAGVAVEDDKGTLNLSPALMAHPKSVLALRRCPQARPFHLVVNNRLLAPSGLACLALFDDVNFRTLLKEKSPDLLVVFSAEDLAVAWSLGLPAIPGHELCGLQGKMLADFFDRLRRPMPSTRPVPGPRPIDGGVSSQAQQSHEKGDQSAPDDLHLEHDEEPTPTALVLVNWSLAALHNGEIAMAAAVREKLLKLEQYLEIEVSDFGDWKPSTKDLDALRFCALHGTPEDVARTLDKSLDRNCSAITEVLNSPEAPTVKSEPLPYSQAWRQWRAAINSRRIGEPERALGRLQEAHENEFIQPLLQAACGASDPLLRQQFELLAQLSQLTASQSLRLIARFQCMAKEKSLGTWPADDLCPYLAVVDRLRAVIEDLKPRRNPCRVPITRLPKPRRMTSSRNSDSDAKKSLA